MDMVKQVYDRRRSLWMERGWSRVQNHDLDAGIVDELRWPVPGSESVEALGKLEKDGAASPEGTEERNLTTFH
jgi:hypothetical protein